MRMIVDNKCNIMTILILVQLLFLEYTLAADAPETTNTITFSYAGASQFFTVPLNVYSLSVILNGGAGGNDYCNNAYGGYGGIAQADITVAPGSSLCLRVG